MQKNDKDNKLTYHEEPESPATYVTQSNIPVL